MQSSPAFRPTIRPTIRPSIRLAGPALLLGCGLLRWVDGRDGSHGSEPWWSAGHVAFLGAVLAFVALVAAVRRVAQHRTAVTAALLAAVGGGAGVAAAIATDLPGQWPEVLTAVFVSGVVGALAALAWTRQVSWLEPTLALIGFVAIAADPDLLPLGAALLAGAVAKAPGQQPREPQPL